MSGSYFCGLKDFDARHALGALERIKEVGVVKHPDGQRLLEVCDEFDHISDVTRIHSRLRFNRPRMASRTMSMTVGASCFHSDRDTHNLVRS